jgi:hypothetical protein
MSEEYLNPFRLPEENPDQTNLKKLVELVYVYCKCNKGRIGSHLKSFYGFPKNRETYPDRYYPKSIGNFCLQHLKNLKNDTNEDRLKIFESVIKSEALFLDNTKEIYKELSLEVKNIEARTPK